LQGIHGVQGVVVVRADPRLTVPGSLLGTGPLAPQGPIPAGVVSCAQLAAVAALGRCPAGAAAAAFPEGGFGPGGPLFGRNSTGITWPAANVSASRLVTLGVDGINVGTDGTTSAVEQARTLLENAHAYPGAGTPFTIGDIIALAYRSTVCRADGISSSRTRGQAGARSVVTSAGTVPACSARVKNRRAGRRRAARSPSGASVPDT
jgi:hypothetical protein